MKNLSRRTLPDQQDCLAIMARYQMPPHIVRHSMAVCGVALYLARRLEEQGCRLDKDLVRAGAMLHDITKRYSFNRSLDHALTGAKLVKRLGYPEVAVVVRQHVRLSKSRQRGEISEAVVVNYADKRVIEDRVATLSERLDYILQRYGRNPQATKFIKKFAAISFDVEEEIFSLIPGDSVQIMNLDLEKECRTT